jgi:hypothetical protein
LNIAVIIRARARLSAPMTTEPPKPEPCVSKKPGMSFDAAFCANVHWSRIMAAIDAADNVRPRRPS